MERRIPVSNLTKITLFVGSYMVPAGETRDIPESQVPPHLRPQEPVAVPAPEIDPFADLLSHNVQTVVAALEHMSTEEIEKLGEMEQQGAARKGVLSAIAEKLLANAAPATGEQQPSLHGSSKLSATIEIAEGKTVQLGEVVAAAHLASGLTAEAWNALPDDKLDELLNAQIETLKQSAAKAE